MGNRVKPDTEKMRNAWYWRSQTRLSSWCSASLLYLETLVLSVESLTIPPVTAVVISLRRSFHEAQWSPWTASSASSHRACWGLPVFSPPGICLIKTIRGSPHVWYWCTLKMGTLTRWSVLWTLKQDCLNLNPSSTNSAVWLLLYLSFLT